MPLKNSEAAFQFCRSSLRKKVLFSMRKYKSFSNNPEDTIRYSIVYEAYKLVSSGEIQRMPTMGEVNFIVKEWKETVRKVLKNER